jgi:N utilization substance protein A
MSREIIEAMHALAREKGIAEEKLMTALEDALLSAYKKLPGAARYARVDVDRETGDFLVFRYIIPPQLEAHLIVETIDEGTTIDPETGEMVEPQDPEIDPAKFEQYRDQIEEVDDTPEDFGRIAAQTAKQVILQRIREAERDMMYEEYRDRVGELITGIVQQSDSRYTLVQLRERVEALLPKSEQVEGERYDHSQRIKAVIKEVSPSTKGPSIIVSRRDPELIKQLFELEVPEIADGLVEIANVAREPGYRSKIAVVSHADGVDPVGACVGPRGSRVRMVVSELRGEKIDIIPYNDEPARFVAKALSPARVREVLVDDDGRQATVVVPDDQLSLAIGREGQNARLAARLTGWRIDIRSGDGVRDGGAGLRLRAGGDQRALRGDPGQRPALPERVAPRARATAGWTATRRSSTRTRITSPGRRRRATATWARRASTPTRRSSRRPRRPRPTASSTRHRRRSRRHRAGRPAPPPAAAALCRLWAHRAQGRAAPCGRGAGPGGRWWRWRARARRGRPGGASARARRLRLRRPLRRRGCASPGAATGLSALGNDPSRLRRLHRRMSKKRVHEIAKERGMSSKDVLTKLQAAGLDVSAPASTVDEAAAAKALSGNGAGSGEGQPRAAKQAQSRPAASGQARPAASRQARPAASGQARPAASGQARPAASGQARPAAPGQARPAAPGQARPATAGQARPAAPGQVRPAAPGQGRPAAPGQAGATRRPASPPRRVFEPEGEPLRLKPRSSDRDYIPPPPPPPRPRPRQPEPAQRRPAAARPAAPARETPAAAPRRPAGPRIIEQPRPAAPAQERPAVQQRPAAQQQPAPAPQARPAAPAPQARPAAPAAPSQPRAAASAAPAPPAPTPPRPTAEPTEAPARDGDGQVPGRSYNPEAPAPGTGPKIIARPEPEKRPKRDETQSQPGSRTGAARAARARAAAAWSSTPRRRAARPAVALAVRSRARRAASAAAADAGGPTTRPSARWTSRPRAPRTS